MHVCVCVCAHLRLSIAIETDPDISFSWLPVLRDSPIALSSASPFRTHGRQLVEDLAHAGLFAPRVESNNRPGRIVKLLLFRERAILLWGAILLWEDHLKRWRHLIVHAGRNDAIAVSNQFLWLPLRLAVAKWSLCLGRRGMGMGRGMKHRLVRSKCLAYLAGYYIK